jgi:hypothetical protein
MQVADKIKPLFIAEFGPIILAATDSRKLCNEPPTFPSKSKVAVIFIQKPFRAQKLSLCDHSATGAILFVA